MKDGKIYGGDNLALFVGEYEDLGTEVCARVKVVPMNVQYVSVGGTLEKDAWELPDIRGKVPAGELPENVEALLDSQRYAPTHQAMTVRIKRLNSF